MNEEIRQHLRNSLADRVAFGKRERALMHPNFRESTPHWMDAIIERYRSRLWCRLSKRSLAGHIATELRDVHSNPKSCEIASHPYLMTAIKWGVDAASSREFSDASPSSVTRMAILTRLGYPPNSLS